MESEKIEESELMERSTFNTPAIESFLDIASAAEVWPENVARDENFLEQVEKRKELVENLNEVFDRLPRPDISFQAAIEESLVAENQVKKAYDSLTDLLKSGDDYRRIVLYLPFEMLPDKEWKPGKELKKSADGFRKSYMDAWHGLLQAHDVRANFVDGDVLETHLRQEDLPRVVKAAHLIPMLVQKGFVQAKDAISLMDETDDPVLKQSIGEALYVMADIGLIPESKLPKNLPIKKHAEGSEVVTEKREKWLMEKKIQESAQPLTEPSVEASRLSVPFSKNLESMSPEIAEIQQMARAVESNPELSQFIYPAALVFGSRLKGYGGPDADIDLAVFVKPGTNFSQREKLQALLRQNFQHEKIGNEIVEFWLDQKNEQLDVHNFDSHDVTLGENYWTHVLFGAAWEGNPEIIRQLREKLLVPYLHNTDARQIYLEELERDTLQYRLMHKGYQKFLPPCGGIRTEHSDKIDSESMFYDSGYRQLATRLFASRVFLPKISNPEK